MFPAHPRPLTGTVRQRRTAAATVLLALALAFAAAGAPPRQSPPPEGARLHFEKTLFVQQTATNKVFAESRKITAGDSLWHLLTRDYGIAEDAIPTFIRAFRSVNPDVDPDHLVPGTLVRVPFKIEQALAPTPPVPAAPATDHRVQPGESLWRILKNRYSVPRREMGRALAAVAAANPRIADLNRLFVGQHIVIPQEVRRHAAAPAATRATPPLPASHRSVLELLEEMGCVVARDGETFLPLGRGRTVRLAARDFPLLTGPAGAKVVLDPHRRLSEALARSIEQAWSYRVLAGVEPDTEAQLARLLPLLGFYEVTEGVRTIAVGGGNRIKALVRWTVIPRAEDLWEGRIHLFFAAGSSLHPTLAATLRNSGFRIHSFDTPPATDTAEAFAPPLAHLDMSDPAAGAGQLLGLLGVPHRVRPEVECRLGGGIHYQLRPQLTFRHQGLDYAIPPLQPRNAETLLSRAGYFTVPWQTDSSALNLLTDLLALLGVAHARTTVEVPAAGALRLQSEGLVLESDQLARFLYPTLADDTPRCRLFLTEARLATPDAPLFLRERLLPWLVADR